MVRFKSFRKFMMRILLRKRKLDVAWRISAIFRRVVSDVDAAANPYFRGTPYTQCTWGVRQPRAGQRRAWQSLNELLAIIAVAARPEPDSLSLSLPLSLASLDGPSCNSIPAAAVTRRRRLSYPGLARDETYCCYACSVGHAPYKRGSRRKHAFGSCGRCFAGPNRLCSANIVLHLAFLIFQYAIDTNLSMIPK